MARLTQLISRSLVRAVQRSAPDLIVHTHFLPPAILSAKRFSIPEAVVITDYAAHNLWLQPGVSRYFVATPEVEAHLLAVGIDEARLKVSGIPISGRFTTLESKHVARAALGLAPERDVLLLMASGLDALTLKSLLANLCGLRWPLSVIIICGRSEGLVRIAERALSSYSGLLQFQILGFAEEMPRYMAASDLLLGKPGGMTTSEALAAGLPFAVVQPYPLQEEANANFLLERGVGLRLEPLTITPYKLRRFLEDAPRRSAMRAAARALAKPEAARRIVRSLLDAPLA